MDIDEQTWSSAQCAAAWGVKPATWLGYVSRGQAPAPLPERDEQGGRRWSPAAVQAYRRPGVGHSRAAATTEGAELLERMGEVATQVEALRGRQRELLRAGRAAGLEIQAMARALGISRQTAYAWLAAGDGEG